MQRGAHVRVTQHFAQALYVHPALHAAGGVGVSECVRVDMGQSIVPAEVIQPSGNAVRMQPFPVIFGEYRHLCVRERRSAKGFVNIP